MWDERKCEMCGEKLPYSKRWHAKFCSPKCRKAHSRRKDELKRLKEQADMYISSLTAKLNLWPDLEFTIRRYLKDLRDLADSCAQESAVRNLAELRGAVPAAESVASPVVTDPSRMKV